jgi:hypothetical protein
MSIYVKKVMEIIVDEYVPSKDRIRLLDDLLEYPNLTLEDLNYIWVNDPMMTNGILEKIEIHPLVTIEWILEHSEVRWQKVVCNPNVTTETVEKYPNYNWEWHCMHLIKDLNIDFILVHIKEMWNWTELAGVITFEDYLTLRNVNVGLSEIALEVCDIGLSSNENITIQDVIDHPEIGWFVKGLLRNPSIQKDLNLDLILSQIGPNPDGTEMFALLLLFFVNEQPVSDELVEKMRLLPPSLGADEWFFKSEKYEVFKFEKLPYFDPEMLTSTMLRNIPLTKINEKVANFHNKCETEIANVVVTHLDQGKETDCGIRQIIREYL